MQKLSKKVRKPVRTLDEYFEWMRNRRAELGYESVDLKDDVAVVERHICEQCKSLMQSMLEPLPLEPEYRAVRYYCPNCGRSKLLLVRKSEMQVFKTVRVLCDS